MQSFDLISSGYDVQPRSSQGSGGATRQAACRQVERPQRVVSRLLIVGADDEARHVLREVLPSESHEVVFEERTCELENCLREHSHFDVIVVHLGTEDCLDLIDVAREASPRTEIILISRLADEKLWIESIQRGAYDLMATPLDRKEFLRIVTNALERNRPSH